MAQLKEEILLSTGQFDKKIDGVIDKVNQLNRTGKNVGNGFNDSLGGMIAKCTALTGALGAGALAAKTFSEVLKRNDAIGDAFGAAMDSAKASVNTFWNALAKGNFRTFITDLQSATAAAQEAYTALDQLETTKTFNMFKLQELETAYKKALILSKDRNLAEGERLKYLNQAKRIMAEQNKLLRQQMEYTLIAANKKMNGLLAQNGLSKLMGDKKMQDWYFGNKETIEKEVERVNKLKESAQRKWSKKMMVQNQNGTMTTQTYYDKGYYDWLDKNKGILERAERYSNFLNMIDTNASELNEILQLRIDADNIDLKLTQDKFDVDSSDYKLHKGINKELTEREKIMQRVNAAYQSAMAKSAKIVEEERAAKRLPTTPNLTPMEAFKADEYRKAVNSGKGYYNFNPDGGEKTYNAQGIEVYYHANEESIQGIYEKYNDLVGKIQNVVRDSDIGVLTAEEAQSAIDAINQQIEQLGLKPLMIHVETDAEKTLKETADLIDNISNSFSNLGKSLEMPALDVAGVIAQAIASIIQGYATATTQAAKLGPWAWVGFSLAGLAQVANVVSSIHNLSGYANGGVIGGSSYSGDRLLARVNSGEMILNTREQSNLFNLLDNGASGGVNGGNVHFVIRGSELHGVLANYNNRNNKLR